MQKVERALTPTYSAKESSLKSKNGSSEFQMDRGDLNSHPQRMEISPATPLFFLRTRIHF
jgi:hypothetical protein